MSSDGFIFGAPILGLRRRVLRGFASGIRGWPTSPPLAASFGGNIIFYYIQGRSMKVGPKKNPHFYFKRAPPWQFWAVFELSAVK